MKTKGKDEMNNAPPVIPIIPVKIKVDTNNTKHAKTRTKLRTNKKDAAQTKQERNDEQKK